MGGRVVVMGGGDAGMQGCSVLSLSSPAAAPLRMRSQSPPAKKKSD